MTGQPKEEQPAIVSERTQQAGEAQNPWAIRARWAWVEPEVWTERMLTPLEQGVKGGKWFRLIDKVYALPNLRKAFARVKANRGAAGVDHVTVEEFEGHLEANLEQLSRSLRDGSYRPQAVRRVWIPKPGARKNAPWGFPRYATGWCRPRSERCWNRSSNGTSRPRATGSVRIGAARTRCAASTPC